jgi:hypothetical protein
MNICMLMSTNVCIGMHRVVQNLHKWGNLSLFNKLPLYSQNMLYISVSQPSFERGTLFFVVRPRDTLTYKAATLLQTRACTRTVHLQQSLSEVVCELSVVASFSSKSSVF